MRYVVAVLMSTLCEVGCEPGRCDDLREQLLQRICTECPAGSTCNGNPGLDRPVVPFSEEHYKMLFEIQGEGCDAPDLGSAPWFCNNGSPECPAGYVCCYESASTICRRQCASHDGG